ncbi:MAG: ABC transporter substrate-binding protein [Bacillota bacterium]
MKQRKSFRRFAIRLTLALVLGLGLIQATIAGLAAEKVTVTFWHDWTDAKDWFQKQADAFNRSQNKIEVRVLLTTGLAQKLLVSVAGNNAPDAVFFDRFMTGQYAARGALTPMNKYIQAAGIDAKAYFASTWDELNWKGNQYGIPFQTDARMLLYNKRTLKAAGLDPNKPPRTWDELKEFCLKLKKTDEKGNLVRVGWSPNRGQNNPYYYAWMLGGEIFSPDGRKVTFNSPAFAKAMEFLLEMADLNGGIDKWNAFSAGFGSGAKDPFLTGQVAMVTDGNWNYAGFIQNAPELLKDGSIGVAPIPIPAGGKHVTMSGGHGLVIPRGAKHPDEAFEWIKFLTTRKDVEISMGKELGVIPAMKVAAEEAVSGNPFLKPFVEAMSYARYRPVHPAFPEIEGFINQAEDQILHHKMSIEEALATYAKQAQVVLDRYIQKYRL